MKRHSCVLITVATILFTGSISYAAMNLLTGTQTDSLADSNYIYASGNAAFESVAAFEWNDPDPLWANESNAVGRDNDNDGVLIYRAADGYIIDGVTFSFAESLAYEGGECILTDGSGTVIPVDMTHNADGYEWNWKIFQSSSSSLDIDEVRVVVRGPGVGFGYIGTMTISVRQVTVSWLRCGENDVGLRTWSIMQSGGDNLVRDDVNANNNQGWYANAGMADGWGGDYVTDTPDASRLRYAGSSYAYSNVSAWRSILFSNAGGIGMEIWVKAANTTESAYIFHNGNGNGMGFYQNGDHYAVHIASRVMQNVAPVSTTEWTHLAVVCDDSLGGVEERTRFFVNGQQVGAWNGLPFEASGELVMGINPWVSGGAEHYSGMLDEARIFSFNPGAFTTEMLNYQCSGGYLAGDLDHDCKVDMSDYALFVDNWLMSN